MTFEKYIIYSIVYLWRLPNRAPYFATLFCKERCGTFTHFLTCFLTDFGHKKDKTTKAAFPQKAKTRKPINERDCTAASLNVS